MRGGRCLSSDAPAAPLRAGSFVLGGGVALACAASIAKREHGSSVCALLLERARASAKVCFWLPQGVKNRLSLPKVEVAGGSVVVVELV